MLASRAVAAPAPGQRMPEFFDNDKGHGRVLPRR